MADAEDLLQDALLAAHVAGRHDARWLGGVLRKPRPAAGAQRCAALSLYQPPGAPRRR